MTLERNWEGCSSGCAAKPSGWSNPAVRDQGGVMIMSVELYEEEKRGSYLVCVEF